MFEIRFETYKRLSTHFERARQWADRTEPLMTPKPPPPELTADDDYTALSGTAAIAFSDAARSANEAVTTALQKFQYHVAEYRSGESWDKADERGPRVKMEDARSEAFAAIDHAQDVMRDELAAL